VFVPLFLGVILVAALAVGIGMSSRGGTRLWADISLIWLIIPLIIAALIPLALLIALIWGLTRLLGLLPGWMYQVQGIFRRINAGVRQGADRVTAPILETRSRVAAVKALRGLGRGSRDRG
jgi:hypothetical protein